jgi:hypothetical protein
MQPEELRGPEQELKIDSVSISKTKCNLFIEMALVNKYKD